MQIKGLKNIETWWQCLITTVQGIDIFFFFVMNEISQWQPREPDPQMVIVMLTEHSTLRGKIDKTAYRSTTQFVPAK